MAHPNDPPPNVAAVLGRLRHHIHALAHEPHRYEPDDLTALADIGVELSQAALGELTRRGLS